MKKNVYEIITIFAPNIFEEKVQTHLKKIKDIIANHNGEILEEDHWDNKKLAYRINKLNSGIYHFIKATVLPTFVADFRKYVSANEEIIRNSVIKVDKSLLKSGEKKVKKEIDSETNSSETEIDNQKSEQNVV
ncbi:MAG: 30S ribosomal protein S6 [Endomicrobiia bacterium]